MSKEDKRIRITASSSVFDRGVEAGSALSAVVDGGVQQLADTLIADAGAILPHDEEIEKDWPGCLERAGDIMKDFMSQAEGLARKVAQEASAALSRKRLREQAAGHVAESPLYRDVLEGLAEEEPLEPEQRGRRLQSLKDELRRPEEKVKTATRSFAWGRRGHRIEGARLRLEKALDQALSKLRRLTSEQCQLILTSTFRGEVASRLAIMRSSDEWLQAEASPERLRQSRSDLDSDPAWTGETSRRHPGSIGPSAETLGRLFNRRCRFVGQAGKFNFGLFLKAFGVYCTERELLPAEASDKALAKALSEFITSEASAYFGGLSLSEVYALAGTPLPIDRLEVASRSPLLLRDSPEVQFVRQHALRVVASPTPLRQEALDELGPTWVAVESEDPNSLVMAQMFDGLSVRPVLANGNPQWQDAVSPDVMDEHAATPKLLRAVKDARIVERIMGLDCRAPEAKFPATEPLAQPVVSPSTDGSN